MKTFEDIERYLTGEMAEEERVDFERQMDDDSKFEREVEDYRMIITGVEAAHLRHMLEGVAAEKSEGKAVPAKVRSLRRGGGWWAAAAGILVIIIAGVILLQSPGNDLWKEYYYADPGLPTPMSATDQYLFYDAMVDYKNEQFSVAIEKWEQLPTSDTIQYYIGSAYLNKGDYATATEVLHPLTDKEDHDFVEKSRWYWSLAKLASGESEEVIEQWKKWEFYTVNSNDFPIQSLWEEIQDLE